MFSNFRNCLFLKPITIWIFFFLPCTLIITRVISLYSKIYIFFTLDLSLFKYIFNFPYYVQLRKQTQTANSWRKKNQNILCFEASYSAITVKINKKSLAHYECHSPKIKLTSGLGSPWQDNLMSVLWLTNTSPTKSKFISFCCRIKKKRLKYYSKKKRHVSFRNTQYSVNFNSIYFNCFFPRILLLSAMFYFPLEFNFLFIVRQEICIQKKDVFTR